MAKNFCKFVQTMRNNLLLFIILFVSPSSLLIGQAKDIYMLFTPTFNRTPIILEEEYYTINETDSIRFNGCKFYISDVQLLHNDKIQFKEKNSFHLINANDVASMSVKLIIPKDISFNQIKFNIGIDSLTNVSGAMGGDLDPTKGMYWTWQSGYINIKLEGQSNLCKTRNNEFEFHLGGYSPYPTCKSVVLNVTQKDNIQIEVDISKFINSINLSEQHHLMTPGKEAALLSEKFIQVFSIVQP